MLMLVLVSAALAGEPPPSPDSAEQAVEPLLELSAEQAGEPPPSPDSAEQASEPLLIADSAELEGSAMAQLELQQAWQAERLAQLRADVERAASDAHATVSDKL